MRFDKWPFLGLTTQPISDDGKQLNFPTTWEIWVASLVCSRAPEHPKWHPKLSTRRFDVFKLSLSAGFD